MDEGCQFAIKQESIYFNKMTSGMPICSRQEAASDIISETFVSDIVADKAVKFHDPWSNHYREIHLQVIGDGIFNGFPR